MTQHQINYWNYKETERHNRAVEDETKRNNIVVSDEVTRHNLVTEGETNRHNVITEGESARHNRASESLQHESNMIYNDHFVRQDAETARNNQFNNVISKYNANTQRDLADSNIQRNTVSNVTDSYRQNVYNTESIVNRAKAQVAKSEYVKNYTQAMKNATESEYKRKEMPYIFGYFANDTMRSVGSLLQSGSQAVGRGGLNLLGNGVSAITNIKPVIIPSLH